MINIGCDACNVIISRKQERERVEAYNPTSNYRILDDYLRSRKCQHLHDERGEQQEKAAYREVQRKKAALAQERFNQTLHEQCKWHPKSNHSTYECRALCKALGALLL